MTTTSFNSEENFNELVFENRNKEYGAYVIRRDYSNTVSRSLLITFGSIFIIAMAAFLFNKKNLIAAVVPIQISDTSLFSVVVDLHPIVEPPKPPTTPEKPAETAPPKVDVVSGVVTDKPTDDNLKPNDQAVVGIGDPKGKVDSTQHDVPTVVVKKPEIVASTELPRIVEEMPELKDMYRIIGANLNYPEIAKENGTEGTVFVSFVVEKDGSVTDVKVLKGLGDGCTEEAVRVVKAMPKWKPGKNHGEPVRVLFNLPIKFRLQ